MRTLGGGRGGSGGRRSWRGEVRLEGRVVWHLEGRMEDEIWRMEDVGWRT